MMNKTMKRIGAALMAAMMVGVMAMPVMADAPADAEVFGTETEVLKGTSQGTDVDIADMITKNFLMSNDITTPAATFKFTAEAMQMGTDAVTNNGTADASGQAAKNGLTVPVAECPDIDVADITVTAGTTGTVGKITKDTDGVIKGFTNDSTGAYRLVQSYTTLVKKDTTTKLTGTDFPHAGEYVYTVVETANTNTSIDATLDYSKASYQIHIFVANASADSTGNANGGLYIAAVSAVRTTKDDSPATTNTDLTSGAYVKVNTTGGSEYKNDSTQTTGNGTQLDFQNVYYKTSQLDITKKVAGAYADQTKFFSYDLKLNLPEDRVANKTASYKAYVYETTDGSTWTQVTEANNKDMSSGTAVLVPVEYTFSASDYKAGATVKLKHNQKLWFVDPADTTAGILPVGTVYELTESGATDYLPSATVKYNNGTAENSKTGTVRVGADYSLKKYDPTAAANSTDKTVIGENFANEAAFLNTYKTVTPTGIVINNLPYILMILVAMGAAFMYIVAKRRKKNQ